MENSREYIKQELEKLKLIQTKIEKDLKNVPEGTLRISKSNNVNQYYWKTKTSNAQGSYIPKKQIKFAQKLAQKDYAQKVLKILNKQKVYYEKIVDNDWQEEVKQFYNNLKPARQKLITPYILSDEKYAIQWEQQNQKIKSKDAKELQTEIYTEKGECVRSKSEKILADKLYMLGIPYIYEMPLLLKGYGHIKPDFKVLNKRTRKEYYWEHFGLMDNKEYCEKAIKKIETYEQNHIYPGNDLILSFETSEHPLNMKNIENIIEKYLL
ncbi:MAG: hypothetical protein Q4B70_07775 [Lachnospiraceae bacterium]|nr:hypothetical protein [Lachnospiraceae bacterium]